MTRHRRTIRNTGQPDTASTGASLPESVGTKAIPWRISERFLVVGMILIFASAFVSAQPRQQNGVTITGTVRDSAGRVISGAEVRLETKDRAAPLRTTSDSEGHFAFSGLLPGTFEVTAEKNGFFSKSIAISVTTASGELQANPVIGHESSASAGAQMQFSDQPSFTIAGVTDWTAAGGHGSDAILRASESLTRDTLALKPDAAHPASRGSDATEATLRTALAKDPDGFEANARLGKYYADNGKYTDAIPFLEKADGLREANFDNRYELARAYYETGNLSRARALTSALKSAHETGDVDRLSAEIDEKAGDPTTAAEELEHAVQLDPSERNYFELGSELLLHRAIWQAKEVFQEGAKAYPESARMQTALGTALFAGALYDEAAMRFCKASDLNPSDPEPYLFMGKIEIAAPSPLVCVEQRLARFAGQQPDNALANYFYAMAIWKQSADGLQGSSLARVTSLLNKAVTVDPKCSDALLQLGNLDALHSNYHGAIDFYHRAIEANPQLNEAHYRLGVAYDRVGEKAQARQQFQLHERIEKEQAAAIDRQRREIKQFVVHTQPPVAPTPQNP